MNKTDTYIKQSLYSTFVQQDSEKYNSLFEKAWQNQKQVQGIEMPQVKKRANVLLSALMILVLCLQIPPIRSFAGELADQIHQIFFVNTNGQTLQGDEAMIIPYFNMGGETVTEKNKAYFEKLLGCSFYLPQAIGDSYHHSSKTSFGITLFNMEYKRFEADHHTIYEQVVKDVLEDRFSDITYTTSVTTTYYLEGTDTEIHIRAGSIDSIDVNKSIYYNINPTLLENGQEVHFYTKILGNYKKRLTNGWTESDLRQAPEGTEIIEYLYFVVDDTAYSITATLTPSKESKEKLVHFVNAFLKDIGK